MKLPIVFRYQLLLCAIDPDHKGPAYVAISAALQAIRRALSPIRKQGHVRGRQSLDFTNRAVAPLLFSCPARMLTNSIFTYTQRISVFKRFSGRVQTVGHMRMSGIHAVERRTRAHAPRGRFGEKKLGRGGGVGRRRWSGCSSCPDWPRECVRESLLIKL